LPAATSFLRPLDSSKIRLKSDARVSRAKFEPSNLNAIVPPVLEIVVGRLKTSLIRIDYEHVHEIRHDNVVSLHSPIACVD